MDEHGHTLAEYAAMLRRRRASYREEAEEDASELQAQHRQLAQLRAVERLSASLANRPSEQALLERHILRGDEEPELLAAKRKRLEGFLAGRPPPEVVAVPPDAAPPAGATFAGSSL